jgi:hypothetical protein
MVYRNYIIIEVEFYGVLKTFYKTSLFFSLTIGSSIASLRTALVSFTKKNMKEFDGSVLLEYSVFSNYNDVLDDFYVLNSDQRLFVLPPASGG